MKKFISTNILQVMFCGIIFAKVKNDIITEHNYRKS